MNTAAPKFPDDVSRWLMAGLRALLTDTNTSTNTSGHNGDTNTHTHARTGGIDIPVERVSPGSVEDASIQALVLDTFLSTFLHRVSGCLFFLHPTQVSIRVQDIVQDIS